MSQSRDGQKVIEKDKCVSYVQKYKQSFIHVAALDIEAKKLVVRKSLIADPSEHWYLSVDLPITNIVTIQHFPSSHPVFLE